MSSLLDFRSCEDDNTTALTLLKCRDRIELFDPQKKRAWRRKVEEGRFKERVNFGDASTLDAQGTLQSNIDTSLFAFPPGTSTWRETSSLNGRYNGLTPHSPLSLPIVWNCAIKSTASPPSPTTSTPPPTPSSPTTSAPSASLSLPTTPAPSASSSPPAATGSDPTSMLLGVLLASIGCGWGWVWIDLYYPHGECSWKMAGMKKDAYFVAIFAASFVLA